MRINYENAKSEIISTLEKNRNWVLSTSYKDKVSSRTMSIINNGLDIYFQTNKCYLKYDEISNNNNVSLCFNNISIEGIAEEIGDWKDPKNTELMNLYKSVHPSSFDAYGLLDGQVVYNVIPTKIKVWKYVDGKPLREFLYIKEGIAEQLDFM